MAVLPTTDITTTLVGTTLGTSLRDVGALCTHANINKFSKYKPIEFNSNIGLSESQFADAQYGLTVERMTTVTNSQGKLWRYYKPYSYGRRLGDFIKYYHDAPVALIQTKGTAFSVSRFDGTGKAIAFSIPQAPSGYEDYVLNVSNITPFEGGSVLLNNYYLGVAIYQGETLKGVYYSYSTIKYSSGVGADKDGASVVLSSGSGFNSNSDPIEDYEAGSYTAYLFISNFAKTVPVGELRMYWPVNYTAQYPESLGLTVLGLNDAFQYETIGIRPTGGVWADTSTDWLIGVISQELRGAFYRFKVKCRFTNLTSSYQELNLNNVFLFYNKITVWGGSVSRAYQGAGYGMLTLAGYAYADIEVDYITPLPNTVCDATGDLGLSLHMHYGASDDGEQFTDSTRLITLEYSNL